MHYVDEIQCPAARLVAAIREHVRKRDPSNTNGDFDTFHIRRGDFQFKATRIGADEIYENSKDELTPNSTIFIATDERDKKFFDPMRAHYDLLFLDDFKDELKGVNTNYYGMDQLQVLWLSTKHRSNRANTYSSKTNGTSSSSSGMIDQLVASRGR